VRWVLFVNGPRLGPAVLFWSLLVVVLLLSVGLGEWQFTPMTAVSWLLLFVGLSQVPVWMGAIVVTWFVVLAWRRRDVPRLRPGAFDAAQLLVVAWTIAALIVLFVAIHHGLLGSPEMQVQGNGSSATSLTWYADRAPGVLPVVSVISLRLLIYRLAMLAWALWLAASIIRWLRWAWDAFTEGGAWRTMPKKGTAEPVESAEVVPTEGSPEAT
jgi:hypothetical protein